MGEIITQDLVQEAISRIVMAAKPFLPINPQLPEKIADQTTDELFAIAAYLRANLDRLTTILASIKTTRVQVKNAQIWAQRAYKDEFTRVLRDNHPEVKSARGFEEKEMMAQAHMNPEIVKNHNFWKDTLSDLDDTADIINLKMRMFKGGLDTLLSQISLIKAHSQYKGITTGSAQMDELRNKGVLPKEEGETGF